MQPSRCRGSPARIPLLKGSRGLSESPSFLHYLSCYFRIRLSDRYKVCSVVRMFRYRIKKYERTLCIATIKLFIINIFLLSMDFRSDAFGSVLSQEACYVRTSPVHVLEFQSLCRIQKVPTSTSAYLPV